MWRTGSLVIALASVLTACAAWPAAASAAIRFDGKGAEKKFTAYVAFLERDPERYAPELATVRQLERSDVEYCVRVGGDFRSGVDGELTTDGERVVIHI